VRGSTQTTGANGDGNGGQPETQAYYLQEKGIVVKGTVGLDWRLAPVFSVGPYVGYERVVPVQGCVEVDVDADAAPGVGTNGNVCGGPNVQAHGYGVVSGGIFLKLTVDPWPR
jgi:hypothetical protein